MRRIPPDPDFLFIREFNPAQQKKQADSSSPGHIALILPATLNALSPSSLQFTG